ncbi:MAG: hypothetical protein IKW54_02425 [Bacteroidales bacterium]|nr:hypothetical protein [Bacteroidales bacterium]
MGTNDQDKVIKAGFMIIRPDDYPNIRIKYRVGNGAWKTLEKFDTEAARDRRLKELLKNILTIMD